MIIFQALITSNFLNIVNLTMLKVAVNFFMLFNLAQEISGLSDFKISKIENCTSFKETVIVEMCELTKDQNINFIFDVREGEKMFQVCTRMIIMSGMNKF